MDRTEGGTIFVALLLHAALLLLLSTALVSRPRPLPKMNQPVDVQLVDETGLVSSAPKASTEAPAPSEAPARGKPEEAAPPEPAPAPEPAPPAPAPKPVPAPKPAPEPKPAPKPAPAPKPSPKPKPVEKPKPEAAPPKAKPAPEKAAPAKPTKASPAPTTGKAAGKGKAITAKGAVDSDDFLKGISPDKSPGKAQAPRVQGVSATAMNGLIAAITRQIQPCADRRASPGPGSERITTRLHLQFARDGSLSQAPEVLGFTGVDDGNSRYSQRVGELAIGIVRECSPLKLPAELYQTENGQGWHDFVFRYKLPG